MAALTVGLIVMFAVLGYGVYRARQARLRGRTPPDSKG